MPSCLLPEFLYPCSPLYHLAVLVLAHVLDYLYPFHRGILLELHPTRTAYLMALRLAKPSPTRSRLRGLAVWLAVVISHLAAYGLLLYVTWLVSPLLWVVAASYVVKVSISHRLLFDTVVNIYRSSLVGDSETARSYTQTIVRRNVYTLDMAHVYSAAIESLAESLVDGYTSPLTIYVLLGPLGALLQRVVNALDSALGYREPRFARVGFVSAMADTIVNYVPARLTAIAIALVSTASRVLECVRRYSGRTESRNAGYPISAMAGALNVTLEKPSHYTIPCGPLPGPRDIGRAVEIGLKASIVYAASIAVGTTLLTLLDY